MLQTTNYDAIVIGSSRGGRLLPITLARAGRKVALIERDHVGGTCINVGCTPHQNDGHQRTRRLPGKAWR
jgi:pyruvate/2-oxoglutarate dehydrogenase complex dihydrolipoamide dehydrogenase (E3) component